ncbi:hypothetical protein [Symmachiella dynata]|uniref:hypothetical protein n=1 Tax=Symmachiella dynata TaxID=2527995 RepID=UPI0030EE04C0
MILAEARTGSTLLGDYLNCDPSVTISGEVLNPFSTVGIAQKAISKSAALRHIRYSLHSPRTRVGGVKLHLSHMAAHGISGTDLVRDFPEAYFIVLYRSSFAEQFVSHKIARQTEVWEDRTGKRAFSGKIHVDSEEFTNYCDGAVRAYEALLKDLHLAAHSIVISYEEMATDAQSLFREKVFPFLHIPMRTITTGLKKQNKRSLSAVVENYDDVCPLLEKYSSVQLTKPVENTFSAESIFKFA